MFSIAVEEFRDELVLADLQVDLDDSDEVEGEVSFDGCG